MAIFLFSVGGLIILAIMVFGITKRLQLKESEDKAFYVINKLRIARKKKKAAVRLIESWYYCCILHQQGILWRYPKLMFQTKNFATEFKILNR